MEAAKTRVNNSQIILSHVSKVYLMGLVSVEALKNVNLEISAGEFIVILGPSGSGKTTLLNVIGGIDATSSGSIKVNGTEITRLPERQLTAYRRSTLGFVFQFFNLIPTLTAGENIEFAAELVPNPRNTLDVLSEVGLVERANHYPGELSGGEQQGNKLLTC